ncbi:hypothetical protein NDU88_008649 [Pleurodeles waltl]|uniref:Uncharacterized protein n=1 Tax=Pleurodeles waltl TaxID=8319 RepID=A0AAV7RT01_PLEWA|nr:hypothetical protein NDU88_008649 [Pleurodeles waltl]
MAEGGLAPLCYSSLAKMGLYEVQWPMGITSSGDGVHCRGRDRHFLSKTTLDSCLSTRLHLHCVCCCDLYLDPAMARVTGERAPAFTLEELEHLVDGVLPLYGPLDQQTVKYATGATAPVAQLPLRRLDSEPASSWKPLSRWAGWRSEGDRPPAQRESQNYRCGLSTAER